MIIKKIKTDVNILNNIQSESKKFNELLNLNKALQDHVNLIEEGNILF